MQVDIEERAESFPAAVTTEASNVSSLNEEDNHSETASSGYASVQGADEPPAEEAAPSEGEFSTEFANSTLCALWLL